MHVDLTKIYFLFPGFISFKKASFFHQYIKYVDYWLFNSLWFLAHVSLVFLL